MSNTIRIEGVEEVIAEIQRRGGNVRKALEQICNAGAEVIRQEAQSNATGQIAKRMIKRPSKRRRAFVEVSVGPHRKIWYARFREYGTSAHIIPRGVINGRVVRNIHHPGSKAHPFMRPAMDNKHGEAQQKMGDEIRGLVEG